MAKDPAVLFYTSDFLSGTSFFTDEQRGQYIRLLCEQHQLGVIPENHMINICKSKTSPVIKKFIQDSDGNYYNERMHEESEKRKAFCLSRSNNKSGRKTKTKKEIISKSYDNHKIIHMENENENENIIKNKDLDIIFKNWQETRIDDFKIDNKFSTGMVINHRKKMEVMNMDQIISYLSSFNIKLNEDLTCEIMEQKKERAY